MWTPEQFAIVIGAAGVFLTSAAAAWVSVRTATKVDAQHEVIKAVQTDVQEVKGTVATVQMQTNHLTEALVAKTAIVSHAEGVIEGKAAEQANPSPKTL